MVFWANFLRFFTILVIIMLMALPIAGYACPVCYGNAESPLTAGMNMAILTLLGVTGSVLGLLAVFFLYLRKKANLVE